MKKAAFSILTILACVSLAFGQDVQIKDQAAYSYAYLDCVGPFQQIAPKMAEFMGAFFEQNLKAAGGPFAIYFDMPGKVPEAELKWLIGMPIAPEASPAQPLKKGEYKFSKVAVCLHVGPYDKIGETFTKLLTYVNQNGWKVIGPAMEKYLNNPQMVTPDKLQTEIVLPVEK